MTMLSASGFQVHDLGVDVAPERFVPKAREVNADLVGLSALLTTTMPGQRLVIEALDREGLRPRVKVMVGGAPVSHAWAETIGADGYGEDAAAAVTLARRLVGRPVVKPHLDLLDADLVRRIVDEAFTILGSTGARVQSEAARALLTSHGARAEGEVVRLPEALVREALATAPRAFALYDRAGQPAVRYGEGVVQFDPGSSCVHVLDPDTGQHRESRAGDLVRLVQVAEQLPAYSAQSTAMVCADVPEGLGDLYRLFLVLWYSDKPVVTGAFTAASTGAMLDLLAAESGSREAMSSRPRAIFDVCPSPPLHWSDFAADSLP